jgi:hypothetical protein
LIPRSLCNGLNNWLHRQLRCQWMKTKNDELQLSVKKSQKNAGSKKGISAFQSDFGLSSQNESLCDVAAEERNARESRRSRKKA